MGIKRYRKQVIFFLDILIISFVSFCLFVLSPIENGTSDVELRIMWKNLFLLVGCITISQFCFKTYNSLWRYAGITEYLNMFYGVAFGFSAYMILADILLGEALSPVYSIGVASLSLVGMIYIRFVYRQYRQEKSKNSGFGKRQVGIVGAGAAGIALMHEIENNPISPYKTFCFFDDDIEKIGKFINGIEVKGPISAVPELLNNTPIYDLILAIPSLSLEKRKKIIELCSKTNCRVKTVPNLISIMEKEGSLVKQIRDINIEDLLGRDVVSFDDELVSSFVKDKVVMVTGGGGSIGSELCRQIAKSKPKTLIIIDIYENNAYDIQQELIGEYGGTLNLCVEIASVRDAKKIDKLFQRYMPNIVFHAAAHKHVPLMEGCPAEAVKNNIFGTYNVVNAANEYKVDKFVLISTDKAVNPTNIMGASKRFCEMILQSMQGRSNTKFVAVRFGNVLGSNGSVIPLFRKQIQKGGPVTVTDKRIIRYFMTIQEAVQLVLEAGAMAEESEVFVLDMGEPVKILELAENVVRLSGFTPYKDIDIVEIGLRPGEKLYEEMLMSNGNLSKTDNNKIFIEHQSVISQKDIKKGINLLSATLNSQSDDLIYEAMHRLVPTYISPDTANVAIPVFDYAQATGAEINK